MRTDHFTFMGRSTCPEVAISSWGGAVQSDDSDSELCKDIPRDCLEIVCDGNRRRVRQLSRWHRGANDWIKHVLRMTRRRWFRLVYRLMWGREYRRRKLLMLRGQQEKLRIACAFALITKAVLLNRFLKLPLRMQSHVLKFGID